MWRSFQISCSYYHLAYSLLLRAETRRPLLRQDPELPSLTIYVISCIPRGQMPNV